MKNNKIYLLVILSFLSNLDCVSQTILKGDNNSLNVYEKMPTENVVIYTNDDLYFSGEYIYCKIFSINKETNTLSTLSKVVYVELIDETKKAIISQKLFLNKGTVFTDLFIPTDLLSGNYKLVGYTKWMNNKPNNNFFQKDICIVNPYISLNKSSFLVNKDTTKVISKAKYFYKSNASNPNLSIDLNQKVFKKRSAVIAKINILDRSLLNGNYVFSVKKLDTILSEISNNIIAKPKNNTLHGFEKDIVVTKELERLPELRGELISGKLVSLDGSDIRSLSDIKIALTVLGNNNFFKVSNTNNDGTFFFNLEENIYGNDFILHILDNEKVKYKIELFNPKKPDYSQLIFNKLNIHSGLKSLILGRSIHNQIDNAYFEVKKDTVRTNEAKLVPFFGSKNVKFYNLDDYTRFPTVSETFIEIIDDAWVKNANKVATFVIRQKGEKNLSKDDNKTPTLVIVDGIYLINHKKLVNFDARKIKSIAISRETYNFGGQLFNGIIAVTTEDNSYLKINRNLEELHRFSIKAPRQQKKYYNQVYDEDNASNRIPDFRYQLYWNPELKLEKNNENIEFFTSDISGIYEMSIKGFTGEGKVIDYVKIFYVKD